MMKSLVALMLVLGLAACNWTSQLDRDFAACVVLVKGGAKCSVETIPTPPTP